MATAVICALQVCTLHILKPEQPLEGGRVYVEVLAAALAAVVK